MFIIIIMNDWFKKLFNIDEKEYNYNIDTIKNNNNCGNFYIKSIKELEDFDIEENKNNNVKLKVYIHEGLNKDNIKYFDVSSLQFNSNEKNKPLFQVASNFNCLEFSHEKVNPYNGAFITNHMFDKTQGPCASVSAPYGLLLKINYYKDNGIDLLQNTDLNRFNGKCPYFKNRDKKINYKDVCIGILENTRVVFDKSNMNNVKYNPNGPKITQIHSSTVICSKLRNKLSEDLLKSAYEGLFLYAIKNKNKDIYLTLIGGGVFNNNIELILETINNTFNKYKYKLPKNCTVYLPIYDNNINNIVKKYFKHIEIKKN